MTLTASEGRLLSALRAQPGQTLSRDALVVAAGLSPLDPLSRCIDTAVTRVRQKLGDEAELLQTDFGSGYRWGPPLEEEVRVAPARRALRVGDAVVDLDRQRVTRGEVTAHLTTLETRLLRRLARSPGEPVATEDLGPRQAVPKLVLQVRQKLGVGAITSTRGVGYTLHAEQRGEDDRFTPLAWEAASLAATLLELEDVVVYRRDGQALEQVAAWGPKHAGAREVLRPLRLPMGVGIVGAAARSGTVERVDETRADPRYLFDLHEARSELVVPIVLRGEVVGVFDSESPTPGAFGARHVSGLEALARMMCASLN